MRPTGRPTMRPSSQPSARPIRRSKSQPAPKPIQEFNVRGNRRVNIPLGDAKKILNYDLKRPAARRTLKVLRNKLGRGWTSKFGIIDKQLSATLATTPLEKKRSSYRDAKTKFALKKWHRQAIAKTKLHNYLGFKNFPKTPPPTPAQESKSQHSQVLEEERLRERLIERDKSTLEKTLANRERAINERTLEERQADNPSAMDEIIEKKNLSTQMPLPEYREKKEIPKTLPENKHLNTTSNNATKSSDFDHTVKLPDAAVSKDPESDDDSLGDIAF